MRHGVGVVAALVAVIGLAMAGVSSADDMMMHSSGVFSGAKVNGGTAVHSKNGSSNVLTLSDDFKVPDTPAPHWQVVDSKGNVYLLNQLKIKGDKINKTITVPGYVKDIAKVQIWCSWAEALLGEASFASPVM